MTYRQLIAGREDLARKIVEFFTAKVTNPDLFRRIQEFRKGNQLLSMQVPYLEFLITMQQLTIWDFMLFETDYATKHGIPNALVDAVLLQMVQTRILLIDTLLQRGQRAYTLNTALTQFLADSNCLYNTIFGFQFIAENYQDSIFKVAIEDRIGDHHIGTGFLMSITIGSVVTSIVLTNEHVVRNAKEVRVLRRSNELVRHSRIIASGSSDLASVELTEFQNLPALPLIGNPAVLDEVISIGYPNVAMARDSYQLVHRGEINSIIQDRNNRTLVLFSAKTGPGNSGGPLINEYGMVVGAVCEDLFYKDTLIEKGQLPYHAAIPASVITEFLVKEYLDPNDDYPAQSEEQRSPTGEPLA